MWTGPQNHPPGASTKHLERWGDEWMSYRQEQLIVTLLVLLVPMVTVRVMLCSWQKHLDQTCKLYTHKNLQSHMWSNTTKLCSRVHSKPFVQASTQTWVVASIGYNPKTLCLPKHFPLATPNMYHDSTSLLLVFSLGKLIRLEHLKSNLTILAYRQCQLNKVRVRVADVSHF